MITFRYLYSEKCSRHFAGCRSHCSIGSFHAGMKFTRDEFKNWIYASGRRCHVPPLMSEGRTPVKVSCINPKSAIFAFIKRILWRECKMPVCASWRNCSCKLGPTAVLIAYQSCMHRSFDLAIKTHCAMPRSDTSRNVAYNLAFNYIVLAANYKLSELVPIMDILISICLHNPLYFGLTSTDMDVSNIRGKNRLRWNFILMREVNR